MKTTHPMQPQTAKSFLELTDFILPWSVEAVILGLSLGVAKILNLVWKTDTFLQFIFFCISLITFTLIALKIVRTAFPLKPGIYPIDKRPWVWKIWNLQSFLLALNLGFFYANALLPVPFRKNFYQLLGANLGKGLLSIAGTMFEPSLITIEEDAFIGHNAHLSGHLSAVIASKKVLLLGRITIKKGAMIGGGTLILPGVTVGEHSMLNAMSVVPMNTQIPPHEIWGGNPAKKLGDMPKKMEPAAS